jgi:hypothetical protein
VGEETLPTGVWLEWERLSWLRHNWQLKFNNRIVATIKEVKKFKKQYEGSYEDVIIEMKYNMSKDHVLIWDSNAGDDVGIIENVLLRPSRFIMKNGDIYLLEFRENQGFLFSDENGDTLSVAKSDTRSIQYRPIFTLLKKPDERTISPWLIALLNFYYMIFHSGV